VVTVGDALTELTAETPSRYDLIVADVFDGARMPASVAGVNFATAAARALRPGGLLAMNLTDLPPLAHSRIQIATLRAAFGDVCLVGGTAMLRGRRAGNVVLVAGHRPGDVPVAALSAAAARDAEPGRVLHGPGLVEFAGGAKARLDEPR
jgi:spermidine synthase